MDYKEMTINLILNRWEDVKREREKLKKNLQRWSKNGQREICFFGAGPKGKELYDSLKREQIIPHFFCDNDLKKQNSVISMYENEIKCISPIKLLKIKNPIVIITLSHVEAVYQQLKELGIKDIIKYPSLYLLEQFNIFSYSKMELMDIIDSLFYILEDERSKKIIYKRFYSYLVFNKELSNFTFTDIYSKDKYVPLDIIMKSDIKIVVDGGAYVGDTLQYFVEQADEYIKEYICYEMDKENYKMLMSFIRELPQYIKDKIEINNLGLSNKNDIVNYSGALEVCKIVSDGNESARVVQLDSHQKGRKISYIKMDIEGSEIDALEGAKKIIIENKPICAICAYHTIEHLWKIPFLLKQLVPEYKIYFRHHDETECELVCYAVLKN